MIENYGYNNTENEKWGIDLETFNKDEILAEFKDHKVTGVNVLVLLYTPKVERVTKGGIINPFPKTDQEYISTVGMVIKLGPDAYKGNLFPSGPYCQIGDWVIFPRGSSLQAKYGELNIVLVDDNKIKLIVPDPSKVSR